ncbi:MAG: tetratricopeptide repeat protein [Caldithrix sp.]|nr:tetratricopeptide repeat protein [Caldithrix sp.]
MMPVILLRRWIMVIRSIIVVLLGLSLFAACSTKKSEAEYYQAATKAYSENDYKLSLEQFKQLIKHYPDGKRAAEAHFMLGFINANDLKNYEDAKSYYEKFINKFPKHDLADDAEFELKNLGKDENDLPIFKELASDTVKKQL